MTGSHLPLATFLSAHTFPLGHNWWWPNHPPLAMTVLGPRGNPWSPLATTVNNLPALPWIQLLVPHPSSLRHTVDDPPPIPSASSSDYTLLHYYQSWVYFQHLVKARTIISSIVYSWINTVVFSRYQTVCASKYLLWLCFTYLISNAEDMFSKQGTGQHWINYSVIKETNRKRSVSCWSRERIYRQKRMKEEWWEGVARGWIDMEMESKARPVRRESESESFKRL